MLYCYVSLHLSRKTETFTHSNYGYFNKEVREGSCVYLYNRFWFDEERLLKPLGPLGASGFHHGSPPSVSSVRRRLPLARRPLALLSGASPLVFWPSLPEHIT